jgi:hypothetical protein
LLYVIFQIESCFFCPGWPGTMILLAIPPRDDTGMRCTTMPSLFCWDGVWLSPLHPRSSGSLPPQ